ncbi:hypothetical protein AB0N17_42105 [Streptomyces sp. NPDC051133]|uniref:hypothetical protein n=1 Tax=Streptomyces sp. NPDC051133 TaxID=3155521 RepID=UPI0034325F08
MPEAELLRARSQAWSAVVGQGSDGSKDDWWVRAADGVPGGGWRWVWLRSAGGGW